MTGGNMLTKPCDSISRGFYIAVQVCQENGVINTMTPGRLPFQAMQMPDLQQLSVLYRLLFLRLIPKAQEHLYRKFLLFPIS